MHLMHREPLPDRACDEEYAWLRGLGLRISTALDELVKGYPGVSMPDSIEEAVSELERAGDHIYSRMMLLDELGDEA